MKKIFVLNLLLILFSRSSCQSNNFSLLDIQFGISEPHIPKNIQKLVDNGVITSQVINKNPQYFQLLDIKGKKKKSRVNFNDDEVKSGKLRSYYYSLTQTSFKDSGNDSLAKSWVGKTSNTVCSVTDFEKVKSVLDTKFGNSVFSTKKGVFHEFDSIYTYNTEKADILLVHGKQESDYYWSVPVTNPFYTYAYLEVRSKTYENDLEEERKKRLSTLRPDEILRITFASPTLDETEIEGSYYPYIRLAVDFETYETYITDKDIDECKGTLVLMDAYDDILKSSVINYKFKTPLKSPKKMEARLMDYNAFSIPWNDPSFNSISNLIKSGSKIKVQFKPTAVSFTDGSVIK